MHELLKSQFATQKGEYEKIISDLKKRHEAEIQELVQDNHSLHLKLDHSSKDREATRKMRREVDDLKRRLADA
jgi:DNA-binding transcriptional regulator GbsR (MarR family)